MIVEHQFGPYFDQDARVLLLGSFPSLQSRKEQFYYAHSQNRFWKVLAHVFGDEVPQDLMQKKSFLSHHHLALWDVIESCEIVNSEDSSIKKARPTDLSLILDSCKIEKIYCLGNTAGRYFKKFHPELAYMMTVLPSTSPANARYSLDKLIYIYRIISIEG